MEDLYRAGGFDRGEGLAKYEKRKPVRLAESWENRVDRLTEVGNRRNMKSSLLTFGRLVSPILSQSSNQPSEPTSTVVMRCADAHRPPTALAAHL